MKSERMMLRNETISNPDGTRLQTVLLHCTDDGLVTRMHWDNIASDALEDCGLFVEIFERKVDYKSDSSLFIDEFVSNGHKWKRQYKKKAFTWFDLDQLEDLRNYIDGIIKYAKENPDKEE